MHYLSPFYTFAAVGKYIYVKALYVHLIISLLGILADWINIFDKDLFFMLFITGYRFHIPVVVTYLISIFRASTY